MFNTLIQCELYLEMRTRMNQTSILELVKKAIESLQYSYTPYSNFKVGAALLSVNDKIYTGCNIENAAYGPTNCAERTAIFKAVSEGEIRFKAIAIVGGKDGILEDYCPPCGVCRQVIREFADTKDFKIILAKSEQEYKLYSLEELLPLSFGPDNL